MANNQSNTIVIKSKAPTGFSSDNSSLLDAVNKLSANVSDFSRNVNQLIGKIDSTSPASTKFVKRIEASRLQTSENIAASKLTEQETFSKKISESKEARESRNFNRIENLLLRAKDPTLVSRYKEALSSAGNTDEFIKIRSDAIAKVIQKGTEEGLNRGFNLRNLVTTGGIISAGQALGQSYANYAQEAMIYGQNTTAPGFSFAKQQADLTRNRGAFWGNVIGTAGLLGFAGGPWVGASTTAAAQLVSSVIQGETGKSAQAKENYLNPYYSNVIMGLTNAPSNSSIQNIIGGNSKYNWLGSKLGGMVRSNPLSWDASDILKYEQVKDVAIGYRSSNLYGGNDSDIKKLSDYAADIKMSSQDRTKAGRTLGIIRKFGYDSDFDKYKRKSFESGVDLNTFLDEVQRGATSGLSESTAINRAMTIPQLTASQQQNYMAYQGGSITGRAMKNFIAKNVYGVDLENLMTTGYDPQAMAYKQMAISAANSGGKIMPNPIAMGFEELTGNLQDVSPVGTQMPLARNANLNTPPEIQNIYNQQIKEMTSQFENLGKSVTGVTVLMDKLSQSIKESPIYFNTTFTYPTF